MEERGESRADLARRLGVSRARVTQVLSVLEFAPEVLELLERQAGPVMVSERALRGIGALPLERQREQLASLLAPSEEHLDGASASRRCPRQADKSQRTSDSQSRLLGYAGGGSP